MNTIIDGHNLIAKIPGLSLSMVDDEQRLLTLLNLYGEFERGKLEVYFDGAPAGQAGSQNFGRVRAHYISQSQPADDAIIARLLKLGKAARTWRVVTSDHRVQAAAREVHAQVIRSEDFAPQLLGAIQSQRRQTEKSRYRPLSPSEVDEWLAVFKIHQKPK